MTPTGIDCDFIQMYYDLREFIQSTLNRIATDVCDYCEFCKNDVIDSEHPRCNPDRPCMLKTLFWDRAIWNENEHRYELKEVNQP